MSHIELSIAFDRFIKKVKAGELPNKEPSKDHERWVKQTSDRLIDFLEIEIRNFNENNQNNKIMAKSLVDALKMTLTRFNSVLKNKKS